MSEAPSSDRVREDVTLADVTLFLNRYKWLILGAGVAAGLLTLALLLVLVPRTYNASATLIVVPSKFASDLKPQTLTVQGYQKLLESDAVVAETKRRLVEAGDIEASTDLRVGHNLHTTIFVSRRSEETELAPMIQVDARFASPQLAAKVTNTWAQVFLERVHDVIGGTTTATVELIDRQYPQAKQLLTDLEQGRVKDENAFQKRYDDAETKWDRQITQHKNETSQMVASFLAESRRLREEFQGDHNLDTRAAQVDALRSAYHDLQNEQARVESELDQKKLQLEAARKQLEGTPQYLTLKKAITDDALWEAVASARKDGPTLDDLRDKALTTQEINPVHTDLSSQVASIEMELNALLPRAKQLSTRLDTMADELKTLDSALRADDATFEKLNRERDAGLEVLQEERDLQLTILERQKKQELDAIDRERTTRIAQLTRGIDQQQKLFNELAENYNEATLAKAEQNVEDVRLGAPAVAPERAVSRHAGEAILAGAVLGCFLGAVLGIARDSTRLNHHDASGNPS